MLPSKPNQESDDHEGQDLPALPPDAGAPAAKASDPLATAVEGLAQLLEARKKEAQPSSFLKDYLPVLTPIAAILVSIVASYYTYEFNHRASVSAASDTLSKLIQEFGPTSKTVDPSAAGEKAPAAQKEDNDLSEQQDTIKAMKLAVYGSQALPAVKMTLGADDADLRNGGVLVAVQMYRAETINREELTNAMRSYYENPALRRGVVEWLTKMDRGLSEQDARLFFDKLKQNFGAQGQFCPDQEENVAREAAAFLRIWHFMDAKDLALGMASKCEGDSARQQAVAALQKIGPLLEAPDRSALVARLRTLPDLSDPTVIRDAINEIQSVTNH
jgi:hypothetical protein